MSYSSGTFSLYQPGNPAVLGTTIDEVAFNATMNDFATGLSTCVLKDGSQTITANLPMSNFKLTGLGAGSALTDSATLQQVQYGFGSFLTSVAGTNTITATATPTPAYTVGQRFTFVPAVTNTGAVTLNISSVGAGAVQWAGAALTGGELRISVPVTVYVTAATPVFEILTPPTNVPQNSQSAAYPIVAADANKHILHPTADNNARTFTIPANASVPFPIGTMITIVNQINTVTIAITSDTLTLMGSGATGSRTLAASGIATILKIASTDWVITGTGIS